MCSAHACTCVQYSSMAAPQPWPVCLLNNFVAHFAPRGIACCLICGCPFSCEDDMLALAERLVHARHNRTCPYKVFARVGSIRSVGMLSSNQAHSDTAQSLTFVDDCLAVPVPV